ncbi:MAG: response regulator transcription factor [Opitutaceae bacterium]|nr:response regulator transcription factor [Opitutaceae bacterium]
MHILIIEDEAELARHISRALVRNGHATTIRHDGNEGLTAALTLLPDLIVLDLGLPGLDGYSLLSELRRQGHATRVIILTARGEVEQRVKGLKAGADDYLPKPFSLDELVARIEAMGRRGATTEPGDILKIADLVMDVPHRRVNRNGKAIALSPREFEVLQVFMQEPGRVFSRTELCERVWQREHTYDTRTVEIFITRLRKKIDHARTPPLIHTMRGVGYSIRDTQPEGRNSAKTPEQS